MTIQEVTIGLMFFWAGFIINVVEAYSITHAQKIGTVTFSTKAMSVVSKTFAVLFVAIGFVMLYPKPINNLAIYLAISVVIIIFQETAILIAKRMAK